MKLVNPTGGKIRNDSLGLGHYHSKRGPRLHAGTDITCIPKQDVRSPITGVFKRVAHPYYDDNKYSGMVIIGPQITVKMFYVAPIITLLGKHIQAGEICGYAQDISKKYGPDMIPHLHLQIEEIDPEILLDLDGGRYDGTNMGRIFSQ